MSGEGLCKELEEIREQVSKILDDAVKRLYDVRDRLAKAIAIYTGILSGETDRYGALVLYIDLINIINTIAGGGASLDIDVNSVLEKLGCKGRGGQ
jgi:hypothetical protein